MTEKTVFPGVAKTKAHAVARKLRAFGILAYWDKEAVALVVYVTKHGEAATRQAALKFLDPDAYALQRAQDYFNVVAR